MKTKRISILLTFAIICRLFCQTAFACETKTYAVTDTVSEETVCEEGVIIDGFFSYFGADRYDNMQSFFDDCICKDVETNLWIVYTYGLYSKDIDLRVAYEKVRDYAVRICDEKVFASATRKQLVLCTLISLGESPESELSVKLGSGTLSKNSIMSLIYGLKLCTAGFSFDNSDSSDIIDNILLLAKPDGGWAVIGQYADPDVTSMVIGELSHYTYRDDVKAAVDRALTFLSEAQHDNGCFASTGKENPESGAQVIIALSSMGIDYKTSEAFIKNGNNIMDGIKLFVTDRGMLSHQLGGTENGMAAIQTFMAVCALNNSVPDLFESDIKETGDVTADLESDAAACESESTEDTDRETYTHSDARSDANNDEHKGKIPVKYILIAGIWAFAFIICIILTIFKRRNPKNYIFTFIISGIITAVVLLNSFERAEDYYGNEIKKDNASGTVTISISAHETGMRELYIIEPEEVPLKEGETVYDILMQVTAEHMVFVSVSGVANGNSERAYISGIDNIYEGEYGDLSGWMYYVNGEKPDVGSGSFKLKDGDTVEWIYKKTMSDSY